MTKNDLSISKVGIFKDKEKKRKRELKIHRLAYLNTNQLSLL